MFDSSVVLERADADTVERVEALLAANDLPSEDVRATPRRFFVAYDDDDDGDGDGDDRVTVDDGSVVGVGGLEVYGTVGLLRSVVVEESRRGEGYGGALCDALEARASERGIESLYLLTTTAEAFFSRRGYVVVPRADVPERIRETTEFADLCPDSATCMRTNLDR